MFKTLKVIKLLVFVSLLSALIWKIDFNEMLVTELYTDKLSYYASEKVKIYASTNSIASFQAKLKVTDIKGRIVDVITADIGKQDLPSQNILQNGLMYDKFIEYKIPTAFQSSIYLINNKYPLIVKSNKKHDITIVYPYLNNLLYHSINHKTVFSENAQKTSFLRSSFIDKYSNGIKPFFAELDKRYSINYITDFDLKNNTNFDASKLLIIYGKSTFWTPKMKEAVSTYQKSGGNLLNITSYLANDICWYRNKNELTLIDTSHHIEGWNKYDSLMPTIIAGGSYSFSGYSDLKAYNITNRKHPIFKDINTETIAIDGKLFSAPPMKQDISPSQIDINRINFYNGTILAYSNASYNEKEGLKGIFLLQADSTTGKILILGTEDWCLKKNIGDKEQLQIITKSAIDFLLRK